MTDQEYTNAKNKLQQTKKAYQDFMVYLRQEEEGLTYDVLMKMQAQSMTAYELFGRLDATFMQTAPRIVHYSERETFRIFRCDMLDAMGAAFFATAEKSIG